VKMTGHDMAKRIGKQLKVTPRFIGKVIDALVEELRAALVNGDTVTIQRLGMFTPTVKARRSNMSWLDESQIVTRVYSQVHFSAARDVRDQMREGKEVKN
jgi:nucleoid DNA-binding protein